MVKADPGAATGTSLGVLLLSGLAGVGVPPSLPVPGISETELQLLDMVLPLLFSAFGAALFALVSSLSESHSLARFLCMVSIILINVAGLLSGQFGSEGLGVLGTLVITSPFAVVLAVKETKQRRLHQAAQPGAL